jgi:UDP-glucose-4-epimerase GalE
VRNFVFSSSAAVYAPSEGPIAEDAPIAPSGVYGRTKASAESLVAEVCGEAGMQWAAMRYFNACGADPQGRLGEDHEPETHLLPLALAAAAGGPPLQVFGDDWPTPDGTCVRDYVHVADLAAGHVAALRHLRSGGGPGAFNLGTGVGTSVLEAVRAVERATGRSVPWSLAPRRQGDPASLVASPARARALLGWSARYLRLEEAAAHQWAWMRAHPSGYAR